MLFNSLENVCYKILSVALHILTMSRKNYIMDTLLSIEKKKKKCLKLNFIDKVQFKLIHGYMTTYCPLIKMLKTHKRAIIFIFLT